MEDKHHSMLYDECVASLTVRDTTQKDAGTYTCEASNDLGTVTTSGVLEIQGGLLYQCAYLSFLLISVANTRTPDVHYNRYKLTASCAITDMV